ncbi:ATP-binding protein [Streptomyces sp. WI04-05B]|uniref:ATP-binding protein n=1 Tax=Streptomyces TaxID=1883 RepID=UPI0029AE068E|nr:MULTISPECIES: LuxR C-terminal-related transcriptional regulator [unclassified Streptomyces]MDX2542314.1 LuxR C-terminal-related transcriptional regulator [Streptomyces sp. WI04-05B]MDX2584146.1 LuxR C-terminal-related transcriptional regulator [Streptomyces sp. WI04-05A]
MGGSAPRTDRRSPARPPVGTAGFVDRRDEQTEARALLARARLVTLTGPGGVGKTRLAAHVADRVSRAFPDGVRFVHLADVSDPDLVPGVVAEALGFHDYDHHRSTRRRPKSAVFMNSPNLPDSPDVRHDSDALFALADQLGERRLLLVLDNCEHLQRTCAEVVGALLQRTSGVRVLATSRHRLGLTEEHLLDVRPLPVPDPDGDLSAAHRHPALALFVDRAAAVVPGFTLTPANRRAVARLCRHLDGLPLAIELAAARMTHARDLDELADLGDLEDLEDLAADEPSAHPSPSPYPRPRHRTLRATIDRSHQLCTPEERLVWARASVLAGDFDLETAEAVCGDGTADVLEAVTGLVAKSVLSREQGPDGGVRYRLLDTLGRYGLGRLRQRPGAERAARLRHRDWTQTRASAYERAWFGPDQPRMAARLHADRAGLRSALEFGLAAGPGPEGCGPDDALAGLRLAGTLWFHWYACGASGEGRYWLDRALDANPGPSRERARALWVSGLLGLLTASPEEHARGRRRAEEALALAERLGDAAEAAHAGYVVGVGRLVGGEPAAALRHFEHAVAQGPVTGGHAGLAGLERVQLATALATLGEADRAVAVCENALRVCEEYGELWVRSGVLRALALAHTVRGDWRRAEPSAREALRTAHTLHDLLGIAPTLDLLALIATARHHTHDRAAVLLGGADRVRSIPYDSVRQDAETRAREGLGCRAYERAYRRGESLGLAGIVKYALREGEPAGRQPEPPSGTGRLTALVPDSGSGTGSGCGSGTGLTRRETEVAALVAEGLANQQIADRLVIARRTAEGHVEHILGKLNLANRTQIAAWVTTHR